MEDSSLGVNRRYTLLQRPKKVVPDLTADGSGRRCSSSASQCGITSASLAEREKLYEATKRRLMCEQQQRLPKSTGCALLLENEAMITPGPIVLGGGGGGSAALRPATIVAAAAAGIPRAAEASSSAHAKTAYISRDLVGEHSPEIAPSPHQPQPLAHGDQGGGGAAAPPPPPPWIAYPYIPVWYGQLPPPLSWYRADLPPTPSGSERRQNTTTRDRI